MPTISVPLTAALNEAVTHAVRRGDAATKADYIRRAIRRLTEDEAVQAVLRAEQEVREGKVVRGNLRKILKSLS